MIVAPGDNASSRLVAPSFAPGTVPEEGEIPWTSASAWRECQLNLRKTIAASRADLGEATAIAERIVHRYDLAGDLFDDLADTTCALCRHPCCIDARVWLDFKDLLLIHLCGQPLPPGQLRRGWWDRCRYLTSHGCTLPRAARPWVCTWYLCPDQRRALKRDIPGGPERLAQWWAEIATLRDRMEASFMAAAGR